MIPTNLRHCLLATLALTLTTPALAQHKCVGADGRVQYRDRPCDAGSKPGAITKGTSSAAPASSVISGTPTGDAGVTINTYDVRGADFNTVLAGLNAHGEYHARADWNITYRYRNRQAGNACAVESVDTDLKLTLTMPRWIKSPEASADLVSRWDRYLTALRTHENGHLEHGRAANREFRAGAMGLSAPDCGTLDRVVKEHFDRLIATYSERDKEYDRSTGHGRTQGAVFR